MSPSSIPSFTTILKDTFSFYKERFGLILGVMVAPMILTLATLGLVYATNLNLFLIGFVVLITWFVSVWSQVALIQAIKDKSVTIQEAYSRSSHLIGAYFWLTVLIALVIAGGFALFIVPGVILAFSFCLAPYVLVDEGAKGMDAMVRSRAYVTTKNAGVIGHLFFIGIIIFAVSMITTSIADSIASKEISMVIQFIVSLIISPISTIYMYKVYKHTREISAESTVTAGTKTKVFYVILAILGPLLFLSLPFLIIQSLSGLGGTSDNPAQGSIGANAQDYTRKADLSLLASGLDLYHDEKSTYPPTLDVLVPEFVGTINTDPSTKQPYMYTVPADGKTYKLCATLSDTTEHCEESK